MHYKEREPPQDSPSAAPHHPLQLREELIWPGGNCLPLQPPRSLTPHHTTYVYYYLLQDSRTLSLV